MWGRGLAISLFYTTGGRLTARCFQKWKRAVESYCAESGMIERARRSEPIDRVATVSSRQDARCWDDRQCTQHALHITKSAARCASDHPRRARRRDAVICPGLTTLWLRLTNIRAPEPQSWTIAQVLQIFEMMFEMTTWTH